MGTNLEHGTALLTRSCAGGWEPNFRLESHTEKVKPRGSWFESAICISEWTHKAEVFFKEL